MLISNFSYSWDKDSGTIYRHIGCSTKKIIHSCFPEELDQADLCLFIKQNGMWTIYGTSVDAHYSIDPSPQVYEMISGIQKYFILGDEEHKTAVIYQTTDGWFYFFTDLFCCYISNPNHLKETLSKKIIKICDSEKEVTPYNGISTTRYMHAIKVDNFIVLCSSYGLSDGLSAPIKFSRLEQIAGYPCIAKGYTNLQSNNFCLQSLLFSQPIKEYYTEMIDIGDGQFLMKNDSNYQKVISPEKDHSNISVMVDWVSGEITKLKEFVFFVKEKTNSYLIVGGTKVPTELFRNLID